MQMRTLLAVMGIAVSASVGLPALADRLEDGYQHYVRHEFPQAIEACKDQSSAFSRLVAALSHIELYNIYKDKNEKVQAVALLGELRKELSIKESGLLERLIGLPGNPNGNAEVVELLERLFVTCSSSPDDVAAVARFVDAKNDVAVNKLALRELIARIEPIRDYVNQGGVMPKEIQHVLSTTVFVHRFVDALRRDELAGSATRVLVLIEEPTLEVLEQARGGLPAAADAIAKVREAVAKRRARFPGSAWFGPSAP